MAPSPPVPRSPELFVAEVNAAASRAAASSHAGRAVGARSSFWIALGEVAAGQPDRAGRPPRGMGRAVRNLVSALGRALGSLLPPRADGDATAPLDPETRLWAVEALLPLALLGGLWSWPALAVTAGLALPVAVGLVWQSRARAARVRDAALDAYAARELTRARRRRVVRARR
jgi:hypothetical protein